MSTVNRVIKNTGYLYAKMGVTVFISLYTTRLILNSLGNSDFGIFTIMGGAIGMLGFLNSTMANATQRFMSYAEGGGCLDNKRSIFNISLILHFFIAFLTLILLLGAIYPLFNGVLNIDPNRISTAKIVYYTLIFSTVLTVIGVPYEAVMNTHENMLYYSIIGIFESFLRLAIAFVCVYTEHDKLIVYSFLMAAIPIVTLSIMATYCHKYYDECVFLPKKYWNSNKAIEIASFSGWNFLTAISSLFSAQGIGLVLNHFYGTVLSAAQGIANQLNSQLSAFSENMMKALNPVIVKSAGANNVEAMNKVTIAGCKFSTFLVLFFAIPCVLEIDYVLKLWIVNVPEWTTTFCTLLLIQSIICLSARSAATGIYAQGDIKWYAIYKSIMNIMPVILTYISFCFGGSPIWLYIPMIVVWAIGGNIVIIYYANKKCGLSFHDYMMSTVIPVIVIASVMLIFGYTSRLFLSEGFGRVVVCCILTTIGMIVSGIVIGLSKYEKKQIILIYNKLLKKK